MTRVTFVACWCARAIVESTPIPVDDALYHRPGIRERAPLPPRDVVGRPVILRQGTYDGELGFGWEKIQQKHKRTYKLYAHARECYESGACAVVDYREVRTVVENKYWPEYRTIPIWGVHGVVTTYCDNPDPCPLWVEKAFISGGTTSRALNPVDSQDAAKPGPYRSLPRPDGSYEGYDIGYEQFCRRRSKTRP